MKPRHRTAAAAALLAGLCLSAGTAMADDDISSFLMAGNAHGVWLVRSNRGSFDVLVRPVGKDWQWFPERDVPGEPSLAAAVATQLNVLLLKPGQLVFQMGQEESMPGLNPRPLDPHWPPKVIPLALCPTPTGFGKSPAATLLVAVPHRIARAAGATRPAASVPAASAPATGAATRPPSRHDARKLQFAQAQTNLAIFQAVSPEWQFLTELQDVHLPVDARVLLAVANETVYALICPQHGPNSMYCWKPPKVTDKDKEQDKYRDAPWSQMPLGPSAQQGSIIAAMNVADRLAIVALAPPKKGNADQEMHLLMYKDEKDGFVEQVVTHAGKPMTWPRGAPPLAAAMGDQFALLWYQGPKLKFATCPLTGQMVAIYDVSIFNEPPLDTDGAAILEKFMWVLAGSVLCLLFLFRSRMGAAGRPFAMAGYLVPAPVSRRFAALLVDLVLVYMVAALVFGVTMGTMTPAEAQQILNTIWEQRQIPTRAAYAMVVAAASYIAYGFFMERRFGATLGKMLLRLRVVGMGGEPLGVREAVLRNIVRIFELMFWPLLLVPLLNRARLRLGDLLARTIVVQASSAASASPPPRYAPPSGEPGDDAHRTGPPPLPPQDDDQHRPPPDDQS